MHLAVDGDQLPKWIEERRGVKEPLCPRLAFKDRPTEHPDAQLARQTTQEVGRRSRDGLRVLFVHFLEAMATPQLRQSHQLCPRSDGLADESLRRSQVLRFLRRRGHLDRCCHQLTPVHLATLLVVSADNLLCATTYPFSASRSSPVPTGVAPAWRTLMPPAALARWAASEKVPPASRARVKVATTVSPAPVTSKTSLLLATGMWTGSASDSKRLIPPAPKVTRSASAPSLARKLVPAASISASLLSRNPVASSVSSRFGVAAVTPG